MSRALGALIDSSMRNLIRDRAMSEKAKTFEADSATTPAPRIWIIQWAQYLRMEPLAEIFWRRRRRLAICGG
jgi:hypothetical protein